MTKSMNRTPIRTLIALGMTAFALTAAGQAQAMPSDGASPESSCELKTSLGSQWKSHGETVTTYDKDGKKHTYKCDNGTWKEVSVLRAGVKRVRVLYATPAAARR